MDPKENLTSLFQEAHGNLLNSKPVPKIDLSFYPFSNLNHTIRLRKGVIYVRISDMCKEAPIRVHESIAHILMAKLYKRTVDKVYTMIYKTYTNRQDVKRRVTIIRKIRSRRFRGDPKGKVYNLKQIFDKLNARYFDTKLRVDSIEWTKNPSVRCLGRYNSIHNQIVVSKSLDRRSVQPFFLEYIVYHEMLHMVHPSRHHNGRKCFHHEKFREDERKFPLFLQAQILLRRM